MTLDEALKMALIEIESATPSGQQELPAFARHHRQERQKEAQQLLLLLEQSPLPWRASSRPIQEGVASLLRHQSLAFH